MSEPIVWPSEPPTEVSDVELPPPPDDRRAVASAVTRIGELALEVVLMACTFGFGWVGWWIIVWADGQSPAKVVLHLHVVRADDGRLAGFGQMAVREAAGKASAGVALLGGLYYGQRWLVLLAALYVVIGSAFAIGDARRRTLWDRLAGTAVLEGDPPIVSAAAHAEAVTPPAEGSIAPV